MLLSVLHLVYIPALRADAPRRGSELAGRAVPRGRCALVAASAARLGSRDPLWPAPCLGMAPGGFGPSVGPGPFAGFL